MKRKTKILLGIAILAEWIYFGVFAVLFLTAFPKTGTQEFGWQGYLLFLNFFVVALGWALVVFFIKHLSKQEISKEQIALWTALLIVGNLVIEPIYWYRFIWKEPGAA
ncbi:MAG: hypothetical protein ACYC1U_05400 [Candidatus Aquicultorales bacterium]